MTAFVRCASARRAVAAPAEKWHGHPNLRRRPHAPNKGRGRLQVQIQRAFMAGGPVLSASVIFDWAYARGRGRLQSNRRWSVHRILRERCEPVGRARSRGRPILWRLRDTAK
jgi:hypothetical protein